MATKSKLVFNDTADRERLRPSQISMKIAERGWMSDVRIAPLVQTAYACDYHQADAILEIAVQNGYVESRLVKFGKWEYRILDASELIPFRAIFSYGILFKIR